MASAMAGGIKAVGPAANANTGTPYRVQRPNKIVTGGGTKAKYKSELASPLLEIKGMSKAVINLPQK